MLGRDFAWLWRAYTVSALGTWLAMDAFPLIAVLVLHAGPAQVSMISATSLTAAALIAVPLGPWIEFQHKRRLMIRADLVRFAVLVTVPVAYGFGALTYVHLLVVAVVVALADIVFRGASGAHLKALVPKRHLMEANGRFETVQWMSTAVGPPAGGALIGVLGPVVTVLLDAVSYVLSALGVRKIATPEAEPPERTGGGSRWAEIGEGWRVVAADRELRLLFANGVLTSALIMATAPLLTYLMLHDLGFSPLEYGLAFGVPCVGGIFGARVSGRLVRRYGRRKVMLVFGVGRAVWLVGLAFVGTGIGALLLVMAMEFGIITCMGVFNPVFATRRLELVDSAKVARMLTAWTVSSRTAIAVLTALWGVLAGFVGVRAAVAVAGVLLIGACAFLPWRREPAGVSAAEAEVRVPG
ncbi:MFS transporter [Actinomadura verrucosospora]|uniref:Transmembrane efflux protein n=1 Tax=Actinomadura verrucosospora TaxID=46165 RepID=A0A7D3VVK3_ACTVE|nr:MFS transporter [Actinomadura verrucosospora]QKG23690.1 transmembrane efflux protein [Actinomadura verrucosospora]